MVFVDDVWRCFGCFVCGFSCFDFGCGGLSCMMGNGDIIIVVVIVGC